MPVPRPPSIGDGEKSSFVLSRSEVALPPTRREVVATVERLLNEGGVQKLVVEVGRPIQVSRLVDAATYMPPEEAPPDDFWGQIRNGRMEELKVKPGLDAYRLLFAAFQSITVRKLKPKMLFVRTFSNLRAWLGVDDMFPVDIVFGLDVATQSDVPEDAVIIAGTSYDEADTTNTIGIRIPVDYTAQVVDMRRRP